MKLYFIIATACFLFGFGKSKSKIIYAYDNPATQLCRINETNHKSELVTRRDSSFRLEDKISLRFINSVFNGNKIQDLTISVIRVPDKRSMGMYYNYPSIALKFSSCKLVIAASQIKEFINIDYLKGFDVKQPLYAIIMTLDYNHQLIYNESLKKYLDHPMILTKN